MEEQEQTALDGPGSLALESGARVAVVGGGPAGSFFTYFLLRLAGAIDLTLNVDIFEPRHFSLGGPAGCNHCGGIVSESLVQLLAADGITLPDSVIQRAIYSYVLHMDVGSVEIESPVQEQRIASIYRGNGPRGGEESSWESFDGFLQRHCQQQGARVIHELVVELGRSASGLPSVKTAHGRESDYDLVVLAAGVNSNLVSSLSSQSVATPPTLARTFISEFRPTQAELEARLGDAMHVFLLDIPRLEFAALIPKGEYVTMAMLGEEIDRELIGRFLASPEVRATLPGEGNPGVCACSPLINVKGPTRPFADRVVLVGDMGVTRLYKDGIGAAYRTGKAAAETVLIHGISDADLERHYLPACRRIAIDNQYGRVIFAFTHIFRKSRFARRVVLRMTSKEQTTDRNRHMSHVLWNMFTGSTPYRDIFFRALHPMFMLGLARNIIMCAFQRQGGERRAA